MGQGYRLYGTGQGLGVNMPLGLIPPPEASYATRYEAAIRDSQAVIRANDGFDGYLKFIEENLDQLYTAWKAAKDKGLITGDSPPEIKMSISPYTGFLSSAEQGSAWDAFRYQRAREKEAVEYIKEQLKKMGYDPKLLIPGYSLTAKLESAAAAAVANPVPALMAALIAAGGGLTMGSATEDMVGGGPCLNEVDIVAADNMAEGADTSDGGLDRLEVILYSKNPISDSEIAVPYGNQKVCFFGNVDYLLITSGDEVIYEGPLHLREGSSGSVVWANAYYSYEGRPVPEVIIGPVTFTDHIGEAMEEYNIPEEDKPKVRKGFMDSITTPADRPVVHEDTPQSEENPRVLVMKFMERDTAFFNPQPLHIGAEISLDLGGITGEPGQSLRIDTERLMLASSGSSIYRVLEEWGIGPEELEGYRIEPSGNFPVESNSLSFINIY